jgi:hypothetical protein
MGESIPLLPRNYYTDREIRDLLAQGHTKDEVESWMMPDFTNIPKSKMGICLYETTTEGTPKSPVYPDTESGRIALVRYCAVKVPAFGFYYVHAQTRAQVLFGEDLMVFNPEEGDFEPAVRKES